MDLLGSNVAKEFQYGTLQDYHRSWRGWVLLLCIIGWALRDPSDVVINAVDSLDGHVQPFTGLEQFDP